VAWPDERPDDVMGGAKKMVFRTRYPGMNRPARSKYGKERDEYRTVVAFTEHP
jgi:hypothetical protein